ncbi:hypothetical protein [Cytobacillus dafuensis]|uniref:Uncharacterized protein n=1 Tax=Cytobacillus dafuensis TaxID=1742359 RepID=A0A5B8Z9W5_CYTDA|nr:hypothetical protein [Cytobacillus dafuensis]QED48266.1 hypothetical protein FSZ17_14025 [Cytobacillus dafuensis]
MKNIQQFYQKTASISLNSSLVALIPPFFLIIYGIIVVPNGKMVVLVVPFLLYSFISYQAYLINDNRSKEIKKIDEGIANQVSFLYEENVLLTFLPAPTLRLLVFSTNGQQVGEIRDINFMPFRWFLPFLFDKFIERKYGLYDANNKQIGSFTFKKNRIEIASSGIEIHSIKIQNTLGNGIAVIFGHENRSFLLKQSRLFMDFQFLKGCKNIARLRKGWMPIEWGKRFKDPNTPILIFEQQLPVEEKLLVYALLVKLFQSTNH